MNKTIRAMAAGAAMAAVATLGPATAALAATTTTSPSGQTLWQEVQHKVAEALSDRQATLARLTSSVESNKYLGSGDRQTLQTLLAAETQGINQLAQEVNSATPQTTTIAELRQDAYTMVHQYRVYLVMAPQVHLTEAAETQTAVEAKLTTLEPKLQDAIAKAGNPPSAVEAYHDLVTQVNDASQATGKADVAAVLAVTPPGFPDDGGPLASARSTLHNAQADLQSARKDIDAIRDALKGPGDGQTNG
jgi:hypothetical protein